MRRNNKAVRLNKSLIFPTLGAALSAGMNAQFGWQWDPWAIGGAGLAFGVLIADGVKPSLAPAILKDLQDRAFFAASFKSLLLIVLVAISAFAAFSFVSAATEKTTGPAQTHARQWADLNQQKARQQQSLDRFELVRDTAVIRAEIKSIKSTPVKSRSGTSTVGHMMECDKVGTKAYGRVSQKYCQIIERKNTELEKSINKAKIQNIITRLTNEISALGAPVEVDPGAKRAADLLGMNKDDVRTTVLVLMALAIELIATFGQLLGKSTAQRPAKAATRPKTVLEWLSANADKNGTLSAGYEEIGRALNISKTSAWRHGKKLIDAGIVSYNNGEFAFA